MSVEAFTSPKELFKFFTRIVGIIVILLLIYLATQNPTPTKFYGLVIFTTAFFLFLANSSFGLRISSARVSGRHKVATNFEESVRGQVELLDRVQKRGEIKIVSKRLHSKFYDHPLIRECFKRVIMKKQPKIEILYGPTENHEFLRWSRSLGMELVPIKKVPKKRFTCVDRKHVRWEKMKGRVRKNHVFYECSFYGARCDSLFEKYKERWGDQS